MPTGNDPDRGRTRFPTGWESVIRECPFIFTQFTIILLISGAERSSAPRSASSRHCLQLSRSASAAPAVLPNLRARAACSHVAPRRLREALRDATVACFTSQLLFGCCGAASRRPRAPCCLALKSRPGVAAVAGAHQPGVDWRQRVWQKQRREATRCPRPAMDAAFGRRAYSLRRVGAVRS